MALYTPLSEEQLAEALRRFGLPPPDRSLPEPKGANNTNYHQWSGGKRWFLRLNEGKTGRDVLFETEVLRFLAREGVPVAPIVLSREGAPSIELAGRPAMLFAFVEGEELTRADVTPERCRRIGAELGRLHALAPRFRLERPNPYGWERVAGWIRDIEPDCRGDSLVAPCLPLLRSELELARALPGSPRGLVHGDLFLDNVLWDGDRVAALLDWEMSCVDALAYDLAVMVNAWCYRERFEPPLARALVAGYRERAPLEQATADALQAYARYVALRFTASRIHAFHLAALPADRLPRKDFTRYRDRLEALVAMGDRAFRDLVGV
jgi:homoserine kinase type II